MSGSALSGSIPQVVQRLLADQMEREEKRKLRDE